MPKLRYGRLAYVNVAPVETAFDVGAVTRDVDVVTDVPARLNALLGSGDLDAAAVSSSHFLEHRDELVPLADLCIAADGAVRSVLLVSPVPPALLDGATIAVTVQSAAGRALLRVVLEGLQRIAPHYVTVDDALAVARAGKPALLIGDAALVARGVCPPACVYDLGEAWRAWTGDSFVYAVWAVRRGVAQRRPDDVAALADALLRARAWGEERRARVIDAACARLPFHRALYVDYFSRLRYVLDERAARGLERFGALLAGAADAAR